jgi:N-formylglutamate deformylase
MSMPSEDIVLRVHGAGPARTSLVLDSPHSGTVFPPDFGSICREDQLRDGEDCFIDQLYLPATDEGVPLLAAQFPRTYIDPNRHAGDIDLDLLSEPWPDAHVPSGKAGNGKALLWRTLDDGQPIYARKLSVAEVRRRIEGYHRPYHETLKRLLDAAHARFGMVHHLNCHSMNPVSGVMGEGGPGKARADFVLGDRDGTTCAPQITLFVQEHLSALGYDIRVNDPYKGVELVRAYANPAAGRHSLQLEINKRLYMDMQSLQKHDGFLILQKQLMGLLHAFRQNFEPKT